MSELEKNIEKLRKGDESAFAYIYDEFESPLLNHLFKMLGRKEKAEEVFQEVMILMLKKIDFYQSRPELRNSFKAWLFRMATNQAIDELRKMKRINSNIEEMYVSNLSDIAEVVIEKDMSKRLEHLIMLLPLIQRTFLNLKVREELSHLEISIICDCSLNNVKQGLFRARKSLKDLILKEGLEI